MSRLTGSDILWEHWCREGTVQGHRKAGDAYQWDGSCEQETGRSGSHVEHQIDAQPPLSNSQHHFTVSCHHNHLRSLPFSTFSAFLFVYGPSL